MMEGLRTRLRENHSVIIFSSLSVEPLDDSFAGHDLPSFLPPTIFSKFDRPTNYGYVSSDSQKAANLFSGHPTAQFLVMKIDSGKAWE